MSVAIGLCVFLHWTTSTFAQNRGGVIDLGKGFAADLNDDGTVVVFATPSSFIRWSDGRETSFPPEFAPFAVNNVGTVAGIARPPGTTQSVISVWRDLNQSFTVESDEFFDFPAVSGNITNLNDSDVIVGWSPVLDVDGHAVGTRGWSLDATSGMLNTIAIDDYTYVRGINDVGTIVGDYESGGIGGNTDRAFRGTQALATPPGYSSANANDINGSGVVAGFIQSAVSRVAVTWNENGEVTELVPAAANVSSRGLKVNDVGQVIGDIRSEGTIVPFVWDSSNGIRDLNALVAGVLDISLPLAINNNGQLLAERAGRSLAGRNVILMDLEPPFCAAGDIPNVSVPGKTLNGTLPPPVVFPKNIDVQFHIKPTTVDFHNGPPNPLIPNAICTASANIRQELVMSVNEIEISMGHISQTGIMGHRGTEISIIDDLNRTVQFNSSTFVLDASSVESPIPVIFGESITPLSKPMAALVLPFESDMFDVVPVAMPEFHAELLDANFLLLDLLSAGWGFIDPGDTEMLVTSEDGLRTGRLDDGTIVQEIPFSAYFEIDGQSGVIFASPPSGRYDSTIRGRSSGPFELVSFLFENGTITAEQSFVGTIAEGQELLYSTSLDVQSGHIATTLVPEPSGLALAVFGVGVMVCRVGRGIGRTSECCYDTRG